VNQLKSNKKKSIINNQLSNWLKLQTTKPNHKKDENEA